MSIDLNADLGEGDGPWRQGPVPDEELLNVVTSANIAAGFHAGDPLLVARTCAHAVRRAPGLCRMTSSVFGGIAARNTGGATVVLEERIALGDPECRVVVWLRGDRRGEWAAAHEYGAVTAD